jgi:hypothetical protein
MQRNKWTITPTEDEGSTHATEVAPVLTLADKLRAMGDD